MTWTGVQFVAAGQWEPLPSFDDEFQNIGHLRVDQVNPIAARANMHHASSFGVRIRMVPAISSASFIAEVCVQNRWPIGLTT
jgi:hypothetical protein